VTCHGIAPQFLIDPITGIVEFKKKTITSMEATQADVQSISISNPDRKVPLSYYIDTANIDSDLIFNLVPQEGVIEPTETHMIKLSFKPVVPGAWEVKVPLYLNDDKRNPKTELTLKGESAFPRILFDRREVILPIVPCGVESKCVFRMINDGYQSCNLTAKICDDFNMIPLTLSFLDGANLGINKTRLKVEANFKSLKPLSMTTRIDFEDDQNRVYSIFCSATADNSIMTNWVYFSRTPEAYNFEFRDKSSVRIIDDEKVDESGTDHRSMTSKQSFTSRAGKATLGYSAIPMDLLDRACHFLMKWTNDYLQGANLCSFPGDLIATNGEIVYK
jgi:hypothetical protein